jgi:GT2 family glycosyltransferase
MEQSVDDVEIVLVDSGSTDATLNIASHFPVNIHHIAPEDFSFGRSLNIGCAVAQSESLVICSAHVYPVYHDWLESLLSPLEKDDQVGLVYGRQRGNEITRYSEHQVFAQWFPDESNENQSHAFCNNANAAIRRSLWERVKYDETLTGLEDIDWARRIQALGYRVAYVAEAEIVHVHCETARSIYNRYKREAIALKRIAPEEHLHFWDFLRLLSTNVSNDCFHAWHDGVLWRNLLSIPMFRLMQFWGGFRGFALHGPVTSDLKRTFYYPRGFKRNTTTDRGRRDGLAIDYSKHAPSPEELALREPGRWAEWRGG